MSVLAPAAVIVPDTTMLPLIVADSVFIDTTEQTKRCSANEPAVIEDTPVMAPLLKETLEIVFAPVNAAPLPESCVKPVTPANAS